METFARCHSGKTTEQKRSTARTKNEGKESDTGKNTNLLEYGMVLPKRNLYMSIIAVDVILIRSTTAIFRINCADEVLKSFNGSLR
jgi:hypothetical protein